MKDELFRDGKRGKTEKGSVWRLVLLAALILLAAGLLIFPALKERQQASPPQPLPTPSATPMPRQERSLREMGYDKDIAALQALVDNPENDETVRKQAAQQIARLVENHQTELAIEEALIGAGFAPRLVVMQGDSITVSLSSAELSGTDGVTILSLCVSHSDVAVENIRIMTADP